MEQALVFASIIVGLAVGDQIMSLNRLLRARARVRWDWLTLWVAALVFMTLVQVWWSVAGSPATDRVTIGQFLPDLIGLVILALLAMASLPDDVGPDGVHLADYYRAQSGYIWTLFLAAFLWGMVPAAIEAVAQGQRIGSFLLDRSADVILLLVSGTLVVVRARWWHGVVLAALSSAALGWLSRSLGG